MVGQVVDRYTLVEKLGSGGMGEVFKGHHASLDQYRAIKVLPPHLSHNQALVERFLREARRCAGLNHPNIVRLEHVGEQDGLYYMVMDYVPGMSLRQLIDDQGALPMERGLRVAEQVCRALAHAHENGVIHRDVKPSNIMIGRGDQAILTDFGVARRQEADEPGLTAAGVTVGTPEYLSPEQIRGRPLDGRSDLYSLGVVLYELFTGELPFSARSKENLKRQHLVKTPDPPRFHNPELPEALERVILTALAKDPSQRFATAEEMTEALIHARTPAEREPAAVPSNGVSREAPTVVGSSAIGWLADRVVTTHLSNNGGETPTSAGAAEAVSGSTRGDFRDEARDEARAAEAPLGVKTASAAAGPRFPFTMPEWNGEQRKTLAATVGTVLFVIILITLLQGLGESAGRRFTAEKAVDPRTGREYGMVRAHGVPIFVITQPFGDLKPAERAEKAAQRLQQMVEAPGDKSLEPEMLGVVENRRGETVIARRLPADEGEETDPDDVIVTVDSNTASAYTGASRTSLALWWRDLLRDQLRLARGKPPVYTFTTRYGRVLDRIYQGAEAKRKSGWIPAPELESAVEELPQENRTLLDAGWRTVPASWKGTSAEAEPTAPGVIPIPRKSASASDTLPGFPAAFAIDGDTATGWQTRHGKRHHGQNHWIKIDLLPGATVSELQVREGQRTKPQFQLRIKQARATFSDGSSRRLWREQPIDPLRIKLPAKRTKWVKLQVEQVFANRHPHESHLYVSEVRLWGP